MHIKIKQGINEAHADAKRGDIVVIVDVIRASTTYVVALSCGVEKIIPCSSLNDLEKKRKFYKNALRAGERECIKIAGYDLGSSPTEMIKSEINGATILSSTTNGSKMAVASSSSPLVVMGSLCNVSAVSKFIANKNMDITIICAGRLGKPVIEDLIGAKMISHLINGGTLNDFEPSIDKIWDICTQSESYNKLKDTDLLEDYDYCMSIDSYAIVPQFVGDGFVKG